MSELAQFLVTVAVLAPIAVVAVLRREKRLNKKAQRS